MSATSPSTTPLAVPVPVTDAPPSRLAAKLAEVMGSINRIAKDGYNDFHKYAYATESSIVAAVRGLLAEQRVAITPSIGGYEIREIGNGDKKKLLFILKVSFTVRDGDSDETFVLDWLGTGEDSGDKALYKAMTGAEKYLLLKMFLIPTGDDPEATDGGGRSTARRPAQVRRPTAPARPVSLPNETRAPEPPDGDAARTITQAQAKRLGAIMREHNVDVDAFRRQLQTRFNVATLMLLPQRHYDAVCAAASAGGTFEAEA